VRFKLSILQQGTIQNKHWTQLSWINDLAVFNDFLDNENDQDLSGKDLSVKKEDGAKTDSESLDEKLPYPKSVFLIIATEFCERFSYYGMRSKSLCPFHQRYTHSFCTHRSQNCKKILTIWLLPRGALFWPMLPHQGWIGGPLYLVGLRPKNIPQILKLRITMEPVFCFIDPFSL